MGAVIKDMDKKLVLKPDGNYYLTRLVSQMEGPAEINL